MAISDGVLLVEDAAAGYLAADFVRTLCFTMSRRLEIGYLPEGTLLYFPSIFFFGSPPI